MLGIAERVFGRRDIWIKVSWANNQSAPTANRQAPVDLGFRVPKILMFSLRRASIT